MNNIVNDAFELAEMVGRQKLQTIFNQSGTEGYFSEDKYNQIDCIAVTKDGKKVAIEVKDRDLIGKDGNIYSTVILSPNKVETLNNYVSNYGFDEGYYTCFYGDEAYIFDVVNSTYEEGKIWVSSTTVGDNRDKKEKPVYHYKIEDAIHLKLVDGKWVNITNKKGGEDANDNEDEKKN